MKFFQVLGIVAAIVGGLWLAAPRIESVLNVYAPEYLNSARTVHNTVRAPDGRVYSCRTGYTASVQTRRRGEALDWKVVCDRLK